MSNSASLVGKKVLHVLGDSKYGGDSLYAFDLIKKFQELGGRGDICATDEKVVERARLEGIRIHQIPALRREIHPVRDLIAIYSVARLCKQEKYDFVHTHTSKGGVVGRIGAWFGGVPHIIHTIHGFAFHSFSPVHEKILYGLIEWFSSFFCNYAISVNEEDRQIAIKYRLLPRHKVITILNGIDIHRFEAVFDRPAFRRALGAGDGTILVGSVGRFAFQKDPLTFVQAADRVLSMAKGLDILFAFVGDGPDRAVVEQELAKSSHRERIKLLGFRTDVEQLIRSFDLYVSTARYEGLPMTLLEAMAAGVPLIATRAKGNIEVVTNATGELFEVGDVKGLAELVIDLGRDKVKRDRLREAGLERVRRVFNKSDMIKKTFDLYFSCMNTKNTNVA